MINLIISAAKHDLGWAVGEQFEGLLRGGDIYDMNPNALKQISTWIENTLRRELAQGTAAYDLLRAILDRIESDDE